MKKAVFAVFVLAAAFLPAQSFAASAEEDLQNVYENTQAFDGGPGSTINTSPAAQDQAASGS